LAAKRLRKVARERTIGVHERRSVSMRKEAGLCANTSIAIKMLSPTR
jgi:hypothetical protein